MVGATVRILANTPLRMDQVGMARPAGLEPATSWFVAAGDASTVSYL